MESSKRGGGHPEKVYFLPNVAIYRRVQEDWTLENNTIDNGHGMVFVETGSPVTLSFKSSPGSEDSQEFSSRRNENLMQKDYVNFYVKRASCLLKLIEG